MLFGLRCRRVLLKDAASKQEAGDTWICHEFMVVMRDSNSNCEWRVTRWESQEPSPSVFKIPDAYHLVEDES